MRAVATALAFGLFANPASSIRVVKQPVDDVASGSLAALNTSSSVVNMMVVWTNAYECHASGRAAGCSLTTTTRSTALNKINTAINRAKEAFSNSRIGATINVVFKNRRNFVESGIINDMNKMNRCEIGTLCTIRDNNRAMMIALFTANGGLSGAARKGPDARFRSMALGKAASQYTLAHEIGHIFGCRENRQDDDQADACTSTSTWFGYRSPDSTRRDLMSMNCRAGQYDCQIRKNLATNCQLMPIYGDPNIRYGGYATGSARECCACQMRKVLSTIVNRLPR